MAKEPPYYPDVYTVWIDEENGEIVHRKKDLFTLWQRIKIHGLKARIF